MHSTTKEKLVCHRPVLGRSSKKHLKNNIVHFSGGAISTMLLFLPSAYFQDFCYFVGISPWLGDMEEKSVADNSQG